MNNIILTPLHIPTIPTMPRDNHRHPLRLPCDNTPGWWDIILR